MLNHLCPITESHSRRRKVKYSELCTYDSLLSSEETGDWDGRTATNIVHEDLLGMHAYGRSN